MALQYVEGCPSSTLSPPVLRSALTDDLFRVSKPFSFLYSTLIGLNASSTRPLLKRIIDERCALVQYRRELAAAPLTAHCVTAQS